MRVAVDRLVDRDLVSPREVVVLVSGITRSETLQEFLEIAKKQRLVLVDRETDRGVQRLHVDAPFSKTRLLHFIPQPLGQVDELGGARRFEPKP